MAGALVETWLRILDDAFEGDAEHSLLGNMANVDDATWAQAAPGGRARSATCSSTRRAPPTRTTTRRSGTSPAAGTTGYPRLRRSGEAIEWAREGFRRMRESVDGLDDADIETVRDTHWGGRRPAWKILLIMAEHCYYHAGEINHARALIQGTDRWPGQ